jgi:hypothetical protein
MSQPRNGRGANSREFQAVTKWGTGIISLFLMIYLSFGIHHQWNAMHPVLRVLAIIYVATCPLTWLDLFQKDHNPFVDAIIVYSALDEKV